MKKLIVPCALALTTLLLVAAVVGCQQLPETPQTPSLTIMVESNIVEAGSSFMVTGSNFNPRQKIWIEGDYRLSDSNMGYSCYTQAEENGSLHQIIDIPEDVVPGDYEVRIYMGKNFEDRKLLTALTIRIQAKAK